MKKLIIILSLLLFFVGCAPDYKKFNNTVVKDKNGNYFILRHSFCDLYFITEISIAKRF